MSVVIPALDQTATMGEIHRIPSGAVVLIPFAALVFLVGLVSEQVASLRFDHEPDR